MLMDRILEIAGDQHGYITTRQATDAGIPPVELRKLAQRGRLDHPAPACTEWRRSRVVRTMN